MSGDNQPENGGKKLSSFFNSRAARGCKFALKAAGLYLWPFAARWEKPFSREGAVKKVQRFARGGAALGALLVLHQVVQGATGTLFPTGEEFLQSQNLDPTLAQQLSDRDIRVRSRDFLGRLHALNDFPTIIGVAGSIGLMTLPGNAYAMPGENGGSILLRDILPENFSHCRVMLQGATDARGTLALLGNVMPHKLERVPLSDQEARLAVAFHEMAHCHTANGKLPGLAEGDADVRGVKPLADALGKPEIAQAFLYARALNIAAGGHDTALYLDAALRGVEYKGATQNTGEATRDIFGLTSLYMRNVLPDDGRDIHVRRAHAMKQVLKNYKGLLDDNARRRGELYIEAVEYYMPAAMKAPPRFGPL